MVNLCVWHFDLYKSQDSKLTKANILCLVWFGNKLVQLLIRAQNIFSRTVRTLQC